MGAAGDDDMCKRNGESVTAGGDSSADHRGVPALLEPEQA